MCHQQKTGTYAPSVCSPGPPRRKPQIQTDLLIGDGFVQERLHSSVGGPDDLTPEMFQLQHKGKATESMGQLEPAKPRGGLSIAGAQEKSVRRVCTPSMVLMGY